MQFETEHRSTSLNLPLFQQLACRLGVPQLFDFQKLALSAVLSRKDSFLVVPTGGGKSFCYILPSLVLPGLVLVVSPLIALMRDQQRQLVELEIPCLTYDSLLSSDEKRAAREKILNQRIKVLYVSPERLAVEGFRDLLRGLDISLVAIDEAHCVHQWGTGFRPEYRRLGANLDEITAAPRMALTATVTSRERLEIIESLRMRNPEIIVRAAPRQNLELRVINKGKPEEIKRSLIRAVDENEGKGIIYASTRKNVDEIYRLLRSGNKRVGLYHGGLLGDERRFQQEAFSSDEHDVIVATKAFGMGIDYPHIRYVLHANMPCSIESYVQEVGRAGRDGLKSHCVLHYGPKDFYIQKFMIEKSFPKEPDLVQVLGGLKVMFQDKVALRLEDLVTQISASTHLNQADIQLVLDFLYREQVYQSAELWNESFELWEPCLTRSEKEYDFEMVLGLLQHQLNWRFEKLRAMHQLVKLGDCPRNYIEQYFV